MNMFILCKLCLKNYDKKKTKMNTKHLNKTNLNFTHFTLMRLANLCMLNEDSDKALKII